MKTVATVGCNHESRYLPISAKVAPPRIELAFVSDDVEVAYRNAVDFGASPIRGPVEKPRGRVVAFARSIEGTLIELCSPMSG